MSRRRAFAPCPRDSLLPAERISLRLYVRRHFRWLVRVTSQVTPLDSISNVLVWDWLVLGSADPHYSTSESRAEDGRSRLVPSGSGFSRPHHIFHSVYRKRNLVLGVTCSLAQPIFRLVGFGKGRKKLISLGPRRFFWNMDFHWIKIIILLELT